MVAALPQGTFGDIARRAAKGVKWRVSYALHGPRVTVVMPLYNTLAFVEDALSSLRAQSYPFFEVLVVDDGSTDGSREVVERFSRRDSRFRLLSQDHQFAGAARNKGLGVARGDYCLFLDSDDVFEPNLIGRVVDCLDKSNADILLFDAIRFQNHPGDISKKRAGYLKDFVPRERPFSPEELGNSLFQCINPAPWTKAYRTAFIRESGIRFQGLQNANDLFFTFATLSKALSIYAIQEPLIWYRIRADSIQRSKERQSLAFAEALSALRSFLVENGTLEEHSLSFMRLAISMYAYNLRQVIKNDDERSAVAICEDFREAATLHVDLEDSELCAALPDLPQGEQRDYELLQRVKACPIASGEELRKAIRG